jgi:hypothetical protein
MTLCNEEFLEALFAGAGKEEFTIVTSFSCDPFKTPRNAWAGWPWWPGEPLSKPGFAGENTYVTVSSFHRGKDGKKHRRKEDFAALRAVMIDDIGTKIDEKKLLLPPSALIETSPGNYQAYLFIAQDSAARDRGLAERLISAMVKSGLTTDAVDPGMKGVTRFGRLPCGINNKAKYKIPFPVRCAEFAPERHYTIEEIRATYNLDLTEKVNEHIASAATPESIAAGDLKFGALLQAFSLLGLYKGENTKGWHDVTCPWTETHTDGVDDISAALGPPDALHNYEAAFRCHHGHCEGKNIGDVHNFLRAVNAAILAATKGGDGQ